MIIISFLKKEFNNFCNRYIIFLVCQIVLTLDSDKENIAHHFYIFIFNIIRFSGTPKKVSKSSVRCVVVSMRQLFKKFIVTDGVATVYSLGDLAPAIKQYISSDPTSRVTEVF